MSKAEVNTKGIKNRLKSIEQLQSIFGTVSMLVLIQ